MRKAKNLWILNNTLHVRALETSMTEKAAGSSIGSIHVRGAGKE